MLKCIIMFILLSVSISYRDFYVLPGWYSVAPYHSVYAVGNTIIAEILATVDEEMGAGWFWIVYKDTNLLYEYYHGVECCRDDAIKAVNRILIGAYWM